ncbi:SGNH/GDSL hydrolase family protein [Gordonia sp. LSe1-13]|uniref:SGNH/GDSL hydrolase family protein n=1 Tax=Gordonia sesuvii TaxID=3116777 RepID=A0ABU7MF55_9ACTN|nr:SGNH/GDSL hydrolase family protein [Gordonia sp. LSe1-13]
MNHVDDHSSDTWTERDDPLLLPPAKAREMLSTAPWRRFAVIGDSIAQGIGDPWPGYADVAWADRVADTLRTVNPDLAYLNSGLIGATIPEISAAQVVPLYEFMPDLVHISAGGNDLFAGADLYTVERDLDELCSAVAATGATLSMFTLADAFSDDFADLRERFSALADITRRLAGRYDMVLTEFWQHPARLRPSWLSADMIHLTRAGHAVVASDVMRSLAQWESPAERIRAIS